MKDLKRVVRSVVRQWRVAAVVASAAMVTACSMNHSTTKSAMAVQKPTTGKASTESASIPLAIPVVATSPDYSSYTQSYHVPFAPYRGKMPNYGNLSGINIRVSINGSKPLVMQVDTGSVGVIVGASDIPDVDPSGEKGSITYVSSGVELDGVYTPATIEFLDVTDADGKHPIAKLPVLAAQQYQFHPGAVNAGTRKTTSRPTTNPHSFMFGVGLGRGKVGRPELNPFLNLVEMQKGTMRRGYTITREGYELGLTASNTGPGYVYEKLKMRTVSTTTSSMEPDLKDWFDGRGSVKVGDEAPIDIGILMDTGLTNFMIEVPDVANHREVPPGTPVKVGLLGGKLGYEFNAGDKMNPSTPLRVTYTHRDNSGLLNTGLKSLATFDYLIDADGGYMALRPTTRPATTNLVP